MKKVMHYGSMLVAALMLVVLAASCSTSPVIKLCDAMDECASKIKDAKTPEEAKAATDELDEFKLDAADENYELTEADKEAYKKSIDNLINAIADKSNEENPGSGEFVKAMFKAMNIDQKIDDAKTLGELQKVSQF